MDVVLAVLQEGTAGTEKQGLFESNEVLIITITIVNDF